MTSYSIQHPSHAAEHKPAAWLRALKTGDTVALTVDGADRLKTTDRTTVTRRNDGSLWADGHPRRDLRKGTWERGGKAWLSLRIDPAEKTQGVA